MWWSIRRKRSLGCAPSFSSHVRWCERGAPVFPCDAGRVPKYAGREMWGTLGFVAGPKLGKAVMIRRCEDREFEFVWAIINDGAQAYRGTIPADRWTEPYMSREKLGRG